MKTKFNKPLLFVKHLFYQFKGFFSEIFSATKGKRLAVLWTIALFFGVIIITKYYFVVLSDKYAIGVDLSNISSNDHIFFSVEKNIVDYDHLQKNQFIMFKTDKMQPFVSKDVSIIKKVIGKSGDHVQVKGMDFYINGVKYGSMRQQALEKLGKIESQMQRDYILPPNTLFVMGSYERSFDSRYWGYLDVKKTDKLSIATPMLF